MTRLFHRDEEKSLLYPNKDNRLSVEKQRMEQKTFLHKKDASRHQTSAE
jgi:hypothetical protein